MKSSHALVDVIIPVHGSFPYVRRCLEALQAQTFKDFNVIICDDASPDQDEADEFYKSLTGVRVIRSKQNVGFGASCNRAAAEGKSPLILFLNSDCIMEPGCLAALVMELDDPKVGVAGGLLMFPEDSRWGKPGKVQHAGMAIDITGKPYHPFLGWTPVNPRVLQRRVCSSVTGALFMTRRKIFKTLDGFDYKYYGRGTYEDVDFCLKVRQGRLDVIYTPNARAQHYVGESSASSQKAFPLQQNFQRFFTRWGQLAEWDECETW